MDSRGDGRIVHFKKPIISSSYVAFIDVLGFSHRIEDDFTGALDAYSELLDNLEFLNSLPQISLRIYSDAILVSSHELLPLVKAVHALNMLTLSANCLVRGGIGYGLHAEQESGANTFVVSQALSRAVHVEKQIKRPCVGLHNSVSVPDIFWLGDADTFLRPLLFFEGITLVNPFNLMWGESARHRVEMMREQDPEHREKHDWFLRLYDAVRMRTTLVPPQYVT